MAHPTNRRRLLTLLGASGAVAVAGCVGGDEDAENGDDEPDYDVEEVCEEAGDADPADVLPEGDDDWGRTAAGGSGTGTTREYSSSLYNHDDYEDTIGYAVKINDHEQWDRDELLDVAEWFDEHYAAITYVEVGDWVYMAMGPAHESNRELLELFEYVSTECAQVAEEIDPEIDEE